MTLCRQFDHITYKLKCATGRHAPRDCPGCRAYDPEAEPQTERDRLRRDAWAGLMMRAERVGH